MRRSRVSFSLYSGHNFGPGVSRICRHKASKKRFLAVRFNLGTTSSNFAMVVRWEIWGKLSDHRVAALVDDLSFLRG